LDEIDADKSASTGLLLACACRESTKLRFSALSGVSARIETTRYKAAQAYTKMMAGKPRFRMVVTMD
jgi:D-arabinose 1-dehydrogenase-like Zn-dependent alcohol dehydrogenase